MAEIVLRDKHNRTVTDSISGTLQNTMQGSSRVANGIIHKAPGRFTATICNPIWGMDDIIDTNAQVGTFEVMSDAAVEALTRKREVAKRLRYTQRAREAIAAVVANVSTTGRAALHSLMDKLSLRNIARTTRQRANRRWQDHELAAAKRLQRWARNTCTTRAITRWLSDSAARARFRLLAGLRLAKCPAHLTQQQYTALCALICRYQRIFNPDPAASVAASRVTHRIDTGNARPFRCQPYRRSPAEREIISRHVNKMLRLGDTRVRITLGESSSASQEERRHNSILLRLPTP